MRCAGIVTFNPQIKRLRDNIDAVVLQVDVVFVFDNGSANVDEIEMLVDTYDGVVHLQKAGENLGIAAGLNAVLHWAADHCCTAVLLLDQDSVSTPGMVDSLVRLLTDGVGLVCPFILDRNRLNEETYLKQKAKPVEQLTSAASHGAITSGSLVDVNAALAIGGFDEALFIDYVDFDFNERLLLNGYAIVKDNRVYLIHEKGKSEKTFIKVPRRNVNGAIMWQPLYKLGYGPVRCYYQTRNRIIFWKKYHRWTKFEGLTEIPLLMALSLLFENNRCAKLRAYARGIKAGVTMKVKEYRQP